MSCSAKNSQTSSQKGRLMPLFSKKDKRKYPIRRDEYGRTVRRRCFDAFDKGNRPAEVARSVGISLKTACTYLYQWNKLPKHSEEKYQQMKDTLKAAPYLRERIIRILSEELDMPPSKVRAQIESPWGIKQLVNGKWRALIDDKYEKERQHRRKAADLIIKLHEDQGIPLADIIKGLEKLLTGASKSNNR